MKFKFQSPQISWCNFILSIFNSFFPCRFWPNERVNNHYIRLLNLCDYFLLHNQLWCGFLCLFFLVDLGRDARLIWYSRPFVDIKDFFREKIFTLPRPDCHFIYGPPDESALLNTYYASRSLSCRRRDARRWVDNLATAACFIIMETVTC